MDQDQAFPKFKHFRDEDVNALEGMIGAWKLKYVGTNRAKVEELKRLGVVEESKQNALEEEKFKLKLGEASNAICKTEEKIKEIEVKHRDLLSILNYSVVMMNNSERGQS